MLFLGILLSEHDSSAPSLNLGHTAALRPIVTHALQTYFSRLGCVCRPYLFDYNESWAPRGPGGVYRKSRLGRFPLTTPAPPPAHLPSPFPAVPELNPSNLPVICVALLLTITTFAPH